MEQYSATKEKEDSQEDPLQESDLPWPSKRLPYDRLDEKSREIVLKHLKIAGDLHRWVAIERQLHREFMEKKSIVEMEYCGCSDPLSKQYYEKYVFLDGKIRNEWSLFPSAFKCYLEKCMALELNLERGLPSGQFELIAVYYDHDQKPYNIRFDSFERKEWKLDRCTNMTQKDVEVMEHYKKGLLAFLGACVEIVNKSGVDREESCEKEWKRIQRVMNIV
jgi:hypothetical protein